MIRPSDITITVSKDDKMPYREDTIVHATLEVHEVATIYQGWAEKEGVVDQTEQMVRQGIYRRVYGELRSEIEEMYHLAVMWMDGRDRHQFMEIKKRIDDIMGGLT